MSFAIELLFVCSGCCVFHKPKKFCESDTDSDDDKPKRQFNRHVHPPGWDATDCPQCEFERKQAALRKDESESCEHGCCGHSDEEESGEDDDEEDASASEPSSRPSVGFAMDQAAK